MTFTNIKAKVNTKGKKQVPLLGPLLFDVRDWGDGKDKDAMLSIETAVLQAYFEAIDDLKERLGFTTSREDDNVTNDEINATPTSNLTDCLIERMTSMIHSHRIDGVQLADVLSPHDDDTITIGLKRTEDLLDAILGMIESHRVHIDKANMHDELVTALGKSNESLRAWMESVRDGDINPPDDPGKDDWDQLESLERTHARAKGATDDNDSG